MSVTFSHKKLQVANCTIDFQIAGNGQGLLLPETKFAWRKIAAQLAAAFTTNWMMQSFGSSNRGDT